MYVHPVILVPGLGFQRESCTNTAVVRHGGCARARVCVCVFFNGVCDVNVFVLCCSCPPQVCGGAAAVPRHPADV